MELLNSTILSSATTEEAFKSFQNTILEMASINKILGTRDKNLMFIAEYLENSSPALVTTLCQANIENIEDCKMTLLNNKKIKLEANEIENTLPYLQYACVIKNIACIEGFLLSKDIFRIECMEVLGLERNKGFGAKLLKIFIQECKNKGIKAIVLSPINQYDLKNNSLRLIEFYKSFGFENLKDSLTGKDMYLKIENIETAEIIKENNLYWKTLTDKLK